MGFLGGRTPSAIDRKAEIGAAILATVIGVRLVWTIAAAFWSRWQIARTDGATVEGGLLPDWRTGVIVGWAGTRGIVTVATALALPTDFPERGMLLFSAFAVTLGTLVIQGLTLRPLVMAFGLEEDDPVAREVREARMATSDAGIAAMRDDASPGAATLRAELEAEKRVAEAAEEGFGRPTPPEKVLRAKALVARRNRLLALRREGIIGDEAFHLIEEELDLADLAVATRT